MNAVLWYSASPQFHHISITVWEVVTRMSRSIIQEESPPTTGRGLSFPGVQVLLGMVAASASAGMADDTSEKWRVIIPSGQSVQMEQQQVASDDSDETLQIQLGSSADFQQVRVISVRQPATVVDEFNATVRLNATQSGLRLALRLVLPRQKDPRTGQPLTGLVAGDTYKRAETWQTLSVAGSRSAVASEVRRLRAALHQSNLNFSDAYFDACVLVAEVHSGTTFIEIGASAYGPIVAPRAGIVVRNPAAPVQSDVTERRVKIERDRILVDNVTTFPIFMPDHGESPETLLQLGVNAVWVADVNNVERMQTLKDIRMVVIATPPHPQFDPADFNTPLQGLPPLDQLHPDPDAWLLGTRVGTEQQPHLLAWARAIRTADRIMRRPLMADVLAAEGVASRQIDIVGISQTLPGGTTTFGESRNRSYLRLNSSAQLTLPWEWIHVEPSGHLAAWRRSVGAEPVFVEPEQVMMQVVAALSAGSRGIGFWKTQSLESNDPAQLETARIIELANLYVDILAPLLASSRVHGHIAMTLGGTDAERESKDDSWLNAVTGTTVADPGYNQIPEVPDAAMLNGAGPSLILAGFWDHASHFVPQHLYARSAELTVAAGETASAWQVFATGVKGLRRQPTAGGLALTIRDFDQVATVLISSDQEQQKRLEARVHSHARRAGQLFIELAELKLARVQTTCHRIDSMTSIAGSTPQLFTQAQEQIEMAHQAQTRRDFRGAERHARQSMHSVRTVQNRYWNAALRGLTTPAASPHTINFAALPDHWRMLTRIESSQASENLIPSGKFDSLRLLTESLWEPVSPQPATYHSSADIVTENHGPNQVLRMRAWKRSSEMTAISGQPTLLVQAPEIIAQRGDVFEISGKVRIGQGVQSANDAPFLVFDSDLGPEFAVRPELEPSWRAFRILREASKTGPFRIWLALTGSAEVFIDDFSVVQQARLPSAETLPKFGETAQPAGSRPTRGSRVQGAGYSIQSFP
ncbi:MAG: hypothetical protein GY826_36390 [Fuerstiella sp.]|nr:hypothetical protein [Fuerstiella sp.]